MVVGGLLLKSIVQAKEFQKLLEASDKIVFDLKNMDLQSLEPRKNVWFAGLNMVN